MTARKSSSSWGRMMLPACVLRIVLMTASLGRRCCDLRGRSLDLPDPCRLDQLPVDPEPEPGLVRGVDVAVAVDLDRCRKAIAQMLEPVMTGRVKREYPKPIAVRDRHR